MKQHERFVDQGDIEPIVQAVISRIEVPMDTRGFGGKSGGVLLGKNTLNAVRDAVRNSLRKEMEDRP